MDFRREIEKKGKLIPTSLQGKKMYRLKIGDQDTCCEIISLANHVVEPSEEKEMKRIKILQQKYFNVYSKAEMTECPHILRSYKYHRSLQHSIVVQETFRSTLSEYVKEQKMGYIEKVKLVESVMRGLVSLNEVKIMHRNVHPDNILICKQDGTDPVYKICGFMDAFDFSRKRPQRGEKPMNVTEFSAPEIRACQAHDEKVDVWSMAALFSWLLFGEKQRIELWNQSEEQSEHKTVLHCPQRTPSWLARVLRNMLEYHPRDRFSMKDAMTTFTNISACSETLASVMDRLG